jgi:hypothetical protein
VQFDDIVRGTGRSSEIFNGAEGQSTGDHSHCRAWYGNLIGGSWSIMQVRADL